MTSPTGLEMSGPRTFQQWLAQGETLYLAMLKECQAIEAQIAELEGRLCARQAEVNQIAKVIGKPTMEGNRRLSAQLITSYPADPPNSSTVQIARALSGTK